MKVISLTAESEKKRKQCQSKFTEIQFSEHAAFNV